MQSKAEVIDTEFTVVEDQTAEAHPCKWCRGPALDRQYWANVLGQPVPFCAPCASRIQFLCNAVPAAFSQIAKLVGQSKSRGKK